MRIEIAGNEREEIVIRLGLARFGKSIALEAYNTSGHRIGLVATIEPNGELRRTKHVSSSIGLPLDSCGRIRLCQD